MGSCTDHRDVGDLGMHADGQHGRGEERYRGERPAQLLQYDGQVEEAALAPPYSSGTPIAARPSSPASRCQSARSGPASASTLDFPVLATDRAADLIDHARRRWHHIAQYDHPQLNAILTRIHEVISTTFR
jgi:hypothetical protein